jgi:hypothetical protein
MPIMGHDEWKRRTKVGLKPRSKPLRFLDACLREYDKNRGSRPHFDQLVFAYQAWARDKADAEGTVRNRDGAVSDLLQQIIEFRDQHMPQAHRGAGNPRNALMRDIKAGAKLLGEGKLKPQVHVQIPIGVRDTTHGNVTYEEFETDQLARARRGFADAHECAHRAKRAIEKVSTDPMEEQRFQRWFGNPNPAAVATVRDGLRKMWQAFKHSPVTIVHRPDITLHLVNGNDPHDEMVEGFSGSGVYGYVWGHTAGSGYRVVMGQWFLGDPDPIEGAAATVYHELTHKVLKTKDHAYGKIKCRGFAAAAQAQALTNADNWSFYAASFLKEI